METNHSITSGFLREKHILKLLPFTHSTLWEWVRNGYFPAPIKLSEKITIWSLAEIDAWLEVKFSEGAYRDASPEPIDQLGHNDGPPLDDVVEKGDLSGTNAGTKKRGGENG